MYIGDSLFLLLFTPNGLLMPLYMFYIKKAAYHLLNQRIETLFRTVSDHPSTESVN